MLTVTLVATFAAAALWQQWRSVEIEAAERARVQSSWILTGALDFSRLMLRLDAISDAEVQSRHPPADHLGEPWSVPVEESRLSSFLAADRNNTGGQTNDDAYDAFLSGSITDLQARLNVSMLNETGNASTLWYPAFAKLFSLLGLPEAELTALSENLGRTGGLGDADIAVAPIAPQRVAQLARYGLSPAVLKALDPYIALLPRDTKVNINTASALVLAASEPTLSLPDAERLVTARAAKFFASTADAAAVLGASVGGSTPLFAKGMHDVKSSYFEIRGRLRLESLTLEERSVVHRTGTGYSTKVETLSRERTSFDERIPGSGGNARTATDSAPP